MSCKGWKGKEITVIKSIETAWVHEPDWKNNISSLVQ